MAEPRTAEARVGGRALRLGLAILLSMLVVGSATLGLFVSSSPEWLSVLVEPVSLLLVPGMVVAMLEQGPHSFAPETVILLAFVFYVVFFYAALRFRTRRRQRMGRASQSR